MPLNKMGEFTFKHSAQQDDLYSTMTAAEIKTAFDSRGEEIKTAVNALVDALKAQTAGDSGAQNIGIETITGVAGANVQDALEDLRLQINAAVAGTIPDGSITQEKLAFEIATDAQSVSIADANNRFTSTHVEGALDELFTSANSVKTNVSGAIGSPATVNDTGSQLAGHITTQKGRVSSTVGDGSSGDSLTYLVDRLLQRRTDIATAVNNKGVSATSADTLAQLATKVSQIPAGKKSMSGTVTASSTGLSFTKGNGTTGNHAYVTVTGLGFNPSKVVLSSYNNNSVDVVVLHPQTIGASLTSRITSSGYHTGSAVNTGSLVDWVLSGNAHNNNGFVLPCQSPGATYRWSAEE